MFIWIILLVIVVIAIWQFGSRGNRYLPLGEKKEDALEILKQRFAKGEMDEEEYEERKLVLEEDED